MRLELGSFPVRRITLADKTEYSNGELKVGVGEIEEIILRDGRFKEVNIHVVHPGESVRIVHIIDAAEPRFKVSGPGCTFPGVLGPPVQVGEGRTHRLSNMAIVTVGPPAPGEPVYWREAIIDMTGPGASYSPLSETINLVLEVTPAEPSSSVPEEDLIMHNTIRGSRYTQDYNVAIRRTEFKVASRLAEATKTLAPDSIEVYELTPAESSLPKVIYGCEALGELLYGEPMGWQPTLLHPNELMDGAMFRPFNTPASVRSAMYFLQNQQIVQSLYRHHRRDIDFGGVLLFPVGGERQEEKERGTSYAANLLRMMGAKGVVLTWLGGGHLCIDMMLLCQKCERLGIRTTVLNPEMTRYPGDTGFVYFVSEADAIVNTGNYEQEVDLPRVDRVIGGETMLVTEEAAQGPIKIILGQVFGATCPIGSSKLAGVAY